MWFYNIGRIKIYNLIRKIEKFNSEKKVIGGRKKVVTISFFKYYRRLILATVGYLRYFINFFAYV